MIMNIYSITYILIRLIFLGIQILLILSLIINLCQFKYFIILIKLITNLESEDKAFNETVSVKRPAGWSPTPKKKGNLIINLNCV